MIFFWQIHFADLFLYCFSFFGIVLYGGTLEFHNLRGMYTGALFSRQFILLRFYCKLDILLRKCLVSMKTAENRSLILSRGAELW